MGMQNPHTWDTKKDARAQKIREQKDVIITVVVARSCITNAYDIKVFIDR